MAFLYKTVSENVEFFRRSRREGIVLISIYVYIFNDFM